jgi:hypothetical protein
MINLQRTLDSRGPPFILIYRAWPIGPEDCIEELMATTDNRGQRFQAPNRDARLEVAVVGQHNTRGRVDSRMEVRFVNE